MFLSGKPWQALASLRLQNQKLFEWGEKVQKHVVKISTYSSHLSWCVWSPQYACIIMVRLLTVHAPCCTILLSGHMVPQPVHAQWGNSPASKVKKKSINWEFKHIVMLLWKNDPTSEVILIAPVQKKKLLPQILKPGVPFSASLAASSADSFVSWEACGSWEAAKLLKQTQVFQTWATNGVKPNKLKWFILKV